MEIGPEQSGGASAGIWGAGERGGSPFIPCLLDGEEIYSLFPSGGGLLSSEKMGVFTCCFVFNTFTRTRCAVARQQPGIEDFLS
jgi:hypothetical protein